MAYPTLRGRLTLAMHAATGQPQANGHQDRPEK
jgi:hypothetical protein